MQNIPRPLILLVCSHHVVRNNDSVGYWYEDWVCMSGEDVFLFPGPGKKQSGATEMQSSQASPTNMLIKPPSNLPAGARLYKLHL